MTIWADADSLPREARELIARRCKPGGPAAVFVANRPVPLPPGPSLTALVVGTADGAADGYIMDNARRGDLVVTRDIPLAARLVDAGLPVMNQTVLLRGINDHADTLEALFRGLVKRRVRPYYLLQMDPVRGTGHLRTPLDAGIAIMGALQGRLSGIALPKLIVDTPNGRGKVPVGPDTVVARGEGRTTLRTFRGELVDYLDPPG